MMTLRQRYRRLTLWNKVGFWGSVASLVGVLIALLTVVFGGGGPTTIGNQSPIITGNKDKVEINYHQ